MNNTIYVENFHLDTRDALLSKLFSHFGKLRHVELPEFDKNHPINKGSPVLKTKGYAFIEYSTVTEAERAIKFFNDLDTTLCSTETSAIKLEDEKNSLKSKILFNLEYKSLLDVRVMSKKLYLSLTNRYKEEKQQAIIMAARRLAVI